MRRGERVSDTGEPCACWVASLDGASLRWRVQGGTVIKTIVQTSGAKVLSPAPGTARLGCGERAARVASAHAPAGRCGQIYIPGESMPGSTNRAVSLTGSADAVAIARQLIVQKVPPLQAREAGFQPPPPPPAQAWHNLGPAGGYETLWLGADTGRAG